MNGPCCHVPDPDISVAASTDENVAPGYHRPYTHDMAVQGLHMCSLRVEYVYLCVVESHNNVLARKMKAGHHTLVRSDVS